MRALITTAVAMIVLCSILIVQPSAHSQGDATIATTVAEFAATRTARAGSDSATIPVVPGDVPTYRGSPARTGELHGPAPAMQPSLRWEVDTGETVYVDPAVVAGIVYVSSRDGTFVALNAITGAETWRVQLGDGFLSSPTVVDGTVYVGSDEGTLYALDAATGQERWSYDAGGSVISSPAVVNDVVVIGGNGVVHAIARDDGAVRWQARGNATHANSVAVADGMVHAVFSELGTAVGDWTGTVAAFALETGQALWTYQVNRFLRGPAVANGVVYVAHQEGVIALEAATGNEIWAAAIDGLVIDAINDEVGAPAVANGSVYMSGQSLVALDAASGVQRWRFRPPPLEVTGSVNPDPGDVASDPAVVGSTIFVTGTTGLYAVEAATGALIWKVAGPWVSNAVVAHGAIYGGQHRGPLVAVS
jgi:eukaryotic-like serine/threonine-protein kinase